MLKGKGYQAFALFCEDTRLEAGNKHTILGAFVGDLLVDEFPANIKFAVYGVVVFDKVGHHRLEWRVRLNKDPLGTAVAEADVLADNSNVLLVPAGLVHVERPSTLAIDLSIDGSRFATLVQTKLIKTPGKEPTSTTAPEPPSGQSPPARKRRVRLI